MGSSEQFGTTVHQLNPFRLLAYIPVFMLVFAPPVYFFPYWKENMMYTMPPNPTITDAFIGMVSTLPLLLSGFIGIAAIVAGAAIAVGCWTVVQEVRQRA